MNKVFVFGILLFVFAAFGSAASAPCVGTVQMTIESGNYTSCAVNELISGAGGSTIITSNGVYCIKTTKFYQPLSDHKVNVQLLNGATCANWNSGDYCYDKMGIGQACNRDMVPGNNFQLGNPDGDRVIYHYYWYVNAYGSYLQPAFPFGMLYQNTISVPPTKGVKTKAQSPAVATVKVKRAKTAWR